MSHTPYYYAPGGKYFLSLDLLGFTAFVRSSFQKKAEEADDRRRNGTTFQLLGAVREC